MLQRKYSSILKICGILGVVLICGNLYHTLEEADNGMSQHWMSRFIYDGLTHHLQNSTVFLQQMNTLGNVDVGVGRKVATFVSPTTEGIAGTSGQVPLIFLLLLLCP